MLIENFDKIKTLINVRESLINTVKELERVRRVSFVYLPEDARLTEIVGLDVFLNATIPNKYIQDLGIQYVADV